MEQNEEEAKRFDSLRNYKSGLTFKSLPYEIQKFESDTVLKQKRERWHQDLAKDVYMDEAINVLEDLKVNNIRRGKLADVRD